MIIRQQKEINEQKKQINERNSRLSRWAHEFEVKMAQTKRRAQDAKDEHVLEVAEQKQRTRELELQNTLQANAKIEAESMLRQEQEKVHTLRLEYDCLQQDLCQQRALADEDDQIAQRTRDSLHGLTEGFVANVIRDFSDDLDRAFHRVRSAGDLFVRSSNRQLRQGWELRNELRTRDSQACPRESQADAAKPDLAGSHLTHSATGAPTPQDASILSKARKRGSEDTNGQQEKKVKTEFEHTGSLHYRGENQGKGAGRGGSQPNIKSVGLSQHGTLDPRPQAVTRRHLKVVTVAQTTLRSI
jgi:hypothetical protein